jgi:hypothetical protein
MTWANRRHAAVDEGRVDLGHEAVDVVAGGAPTALAGRPTITTNSLPKCRAGRLGCSADEPRGVDSAVVDLQDHVWVEHLEDLTDAASSARCTER